jgi:hypothetical protein
VGQLEGRRERRGGVVTIPWPTLALFAFVWTAVIGVSVYLGVNYFIERRTGRKV